MNWFVDVWMRSYHRCAKGLFISCADLCEWIVDRSEKLWKKCALWRVLWEKIWLDVMINSALEYNVERKVEKLIKAWITSGNEQLLTDFRIYVSGRLFLSKEKPLVLFSTSRERVPLVGDWLMGPTDSHVLTRSLMGSQAASRDERPRGGITPDVTCPGSSQARTLLHREVKLVQEPWKKQLTRWRTGGHSVPVKDHDNGVSGWCVCRSPIVAWAWHWCPFQVASATLYQARSRVENLHVENVKVGPMRRQKKRLPRCNRWESYS